MPRFFQLSQPLEGGHDLLIAAPPQVGAAAGAAEQGVPGKEHVPHPQGDGAGGVARGLHHLDGEGTQGETVPLLVVLQTGHLPGQRVQGGPGPVGVRLVDIHLGVREALLQIGHTGGVVVVAVGEEDVLHLRPVRLEHLGDLVRLVARVDDGGLVGLVVLQNIAVGADGSHLHHFYLHKNLPPCF